MQIFHIIGLVGSGKTTFIKNHFPTYPTFDIQTIYRKYGFVPADLKNSQRYHQFAGALQNYFISFLELQQSKNSKVVIVESSGANQGLNAILKRCGIPVFVIWIQTSQTNPPSSEFLATRPYAKSLNLYLLDLYAKQKLLPIPAEYSWDTNKFIPVLPEPIQRFFSTPPKPNHETTQGDPKQFYDQDLKKYVCPGCAAIFSKHLYILAHWKRFPEHFSLVSQKN